MKDVIDPVEVMARAMLGPEYPWDGLSDDPPGFAAHREETREKYRTQARAALTAASEAGWRFMPRESNTADRPQWRLMETRPEDVDCFLAAVEVRNQRTGEDYWDIHLVTLDDETGEINEDTGWTLDDYTWWALRPLPPVGIGADNPVFQGGQE
jgi:hypothetical protein